MALAAANPAAMAASVETACALVEATWPEGAFDSAAADYALSHLGLPAFDLAAMTGIYGVGEPGRAHELLDVVTYTNSSVIGGVAQVASSHSTRSGESSEVYGLDRLSKSEGGSATAYAYDGRGSVAQTLGASGSVASWHVWGAFGEQEAGSALGELPSYGFNGEESHPQTGLQYLRARYYDAESGRFGVQDSYLGQISDPLSLNRYLYCLSDPLNLIDPSGYASNRINMTVALQPMRPRPSCPIINSDRVLHPRPTNYIYADLPVGRWNISDKEAWNTTKYGIANWNYGDALRTGAPPDVVEAYRQAALYYRTKLVKHYCGTADYIGSPQASKLGLSDVVSAVLWGTAPFVANQATQLGLIDPLISFVIGATRDESGIFHISQNYWQSIPIVGYNDLYDLVFKGVSGVWGGGADSRKYSFKHNGEDFVIWSWKGDYANLGSGAETGIYHGNGSGHNLTAVDMSMQMSLTLKNTVTGQTIFEHNPTEDQWWVNGFDPKGQGTSHADLESKTVMDFSNNPSLFETFRNEWENRADTPWVFDSDNRKATLVW